VQRILSEFNVIQDQKRNVPMSPKGGKTLNLSKREIKQNKNPESKVIKSAKKQIGTCINIVRFMAENSYFSGKAVSVIEERIKPLLVLFVQHPNDVDFDDDLVFMVDSLIKK
jgi:L-arabinose isomerase